jgi:hypothetical protein
MSGFSGSERTIAPVWTQSDLQRQIEAKAAGLLPGAGQAFTTPVPQGGTEYDAISKILNSALGGVEGGVPSWYTGTFKDLAQTGGSNPLDIQSLVNAIKTEVLASQPARQATATKMGMPYNAPGAGFESIMGALPGLLNYSQRNKALGRMTTMAPLALQAANQSISQPYTAVMAADLLRKPEVDQWQNSKDIFDRLNPDYKDLASLAGATGTWNTPETLYTPGWGETILPSLIGAAGTIAGGYFGGPLGASLGGALGSGLGSVVKGSLTKNTNKYSLR